RREPANRDRTRTSTDSGKASRKSSATRAAGGHLSAQRDRLRRGARCIVAERRSGSGRPDERTRRRRRLLTSACVVSRKSRFTPPPERGKERAAPRGASPRAPEIMTEDVRQEVALLPPIRLVRPSAPLQWLVAGWRDFLRQPVISIFYGVTFALMGALLVGSF